jgi:type II secretory pathway pseudopilin PulG
MAKPIRSGFTVVEAVIALAMLMILGIIVAQAIAWGLQERARTAAHSAALELAANVLEAARAEPWEKLDKSWADAQQVPSDMDAVVPDAKVAVTVAPEPKLPECRRVTVVVSWQFAPQPAKTVQLTTLLSRRDNKKTGGTP